ncbi:hypothetical protein D3C86_1487340 [compost metagenome]
MAEEFGLDVTVDEKIAAQLAHQAKAAPGEGHIELDLERWRRKHQSAHLRRVVMGPGSNQYRANALGDQGQLLLGQVVYGVQVVDEGLHVTHTAGKAGAVAACARRLPMPARVPGKERHLRQGQLIDQVGNAPGMLMAAVEQHNAAALGWLAAGRPISIIE